MTDALPQLRLRLPGQWWQVPLHDEAQARESVKRLVERQLGKSDEHARLRAELRSQFLAALETAIAGDGQSLHIALDVVEGVPISATLAVMLPPLGMTPAVGTASEAVLEVLERGMRELPDAPGETMVRVSAGRGEAIRTLRRETRLVRDEQGAAEELPTLLADYWVAVPGTKRVMLLAFMTVFAELEEVMVDFFDAIVRVIAWEEASDSTPVPSRSSP
jgi:hypothetical protein